jgi:magnesium-transporting ATPase (P-type)
VAPAETPSAEAAHASGAGGLTGVEALRRLTRDGPNLLPLAKQPSALRHLVAEFTHFFAALFWVAAALAFIAGMPQLGVAVIIVITINALFAFFEQQRAEHAAERLRSMLPRRATVRRDGQILVITAEDLVVGDRVLLAGGDQLSADCTLDVVHSLAVDASSLTGESRSEHPDVGDSLFAGSFVVEGEGEATVRATGADTRLAGIAGLTRRARPPTTPLRRELDRISRIIALMAVSVGVVFFLISMLVGTPASDGFLFAVGITVAVVPSGLLPALTLSLAVGAQRMAARNALIRNLESVETLGSTTFICTDKTGTLTRNEMAVVAVWTAGMTTEVAPSGYVPTPISVLIPEVSVRGVGEDLRGLIRVAELARECSTGRIVEIDGAWRPQGDPMEAAIDCFARRVGAPAERVTNLPRVIARYPFDPRRRVMSVVLSDHVAVKGAPDAVLPRCSARSTPADLIGLNSARAALDEFAHRGLRVIAVAERAWIDGEVSSGSMSVERDLELVGLLAFEDPPRAEAAAALAACRRAGVRVAMVTGDHPATAKSIAIEVGLALDDSEAIIGADLPGDDEQLGALLDRDGVVVARVDPEDKLRIARALGARGHVVAMTGDGVNDAPALRMASIGIAMGRSGTDVARDAADLVLLDDDFATIVVAIEQGRSTFSNIRRFLTFHMTANVAELTPFLVWALSGGRFPLALGVLQIIALDVGADIPPSLALGAEPPAEHVLDRPPTKRHLIDGGLLARSLLWLGPTLSVWAMLTFVSSFAFGGWRPGQSFPGGAAQLQASGAAFTAVVVGQMANALACRSTQLRAWKLSVRRNSLMLGALVLQVLLLGVFLLVGPIAELLDQAWPSVGGLMVAVLAFPVVILVDTLQKESTLRRRLRHLVRPRA